MQVNLENKEAETNYGIKLSNDSRVECSTSHKFVSITIGGIVSPRVLIQFDSSDFDIILEMTWLCTYGVKIGCGGPKVILRDEQGREIRFMVIERKNLVLSILLWKQVSSYVKDMLCIGVMLLAFILRKEKAEDILIVCEFIDVFLKNYQECSAKRN